MVGFNKIQDCEFVIDRMTKIVKSQLDNEMLIFILLAILQKTPRFGSHPFAFSDILSNTSFTQPSNKLRRRLKIWSKTYRVDYRWSLSGASGPFSESSLFISWQPRIHKAPYLKRSIRTNSNLGRIFF